MVAIWYHVDIADNIPTHDNVEIVKTGAKGLPDIYPFILHELKYHKEAFSKMMSLLCLLPLLHVALSASSVDVSLEPLLNTKTAFTRVDLDGYITMMEEFESYVPIPVQTIVYNMPDSAREHIVATVNNIGSGKLKIPNSVTSITTWIQTNDPVIGERVSKALQELMDIIGGFKDTTKVKFDKWWKAAFTAVSGDNKGRANRIAHLISNFKAAWDKTDDVTKKDVKANCPQAYKLLMSGFAARFATAAKVFAASGMTADIKKLSAVAYSPSPRHAFMRAAPVIDNAVEGF